ncbi:MAG: hypothetical protein R3B09_13700 [Nannocystaceae bacterium]
MGIDLTLALADHPEPRRDPADRVIAWARGYVPITWWTFFTAEDAVLGPWGLAMIARADAALERLRRRAPALRAAAGRHALGLRSIEAALRGAPSGFLRAELHELYEARPSDLAALCDPERLDVWPLRLDRGRILVTEHHGGAAADGVVGRVPTAAGASTPPERDDLEARSIAALTDGDPTALDLLEESLARRLEDTYAPWSGLTRRRWADGRADEAADEVLQALVEGRDEPFAPLARTSAHFAAYALSRAADRAYDRRHALRRALRRSSAPLAAPIALRFGLACPSLDGLLMAEWLDGGAPPRAVATREAALACRLAAAGAPEWPLAPRDPIAVVERALEGASPTLLEMGRAPALEHSRALTLTRSRAARWTDRGDDEEAMVEAGWRAAGALCASAAALDPAAREALRALPEPDEPFLRGAPRACVRLALGDLEALPDLLVDDAARSWVIVDALAAAGAGDHALPWLTAQARAGSFAAAALLLESEVADDESVAIARGVAASALERVQALRDNYGEGLITHEELDAGLAELAALARALGPDGATLRAALDE